MRLFLHLVTFSFATCEIFTSSANMEKTHQLEGSLLTNIQHYILTEEKRLHQVKELMNQLNKMSLGSITKSPGHPLNFYLMFKRFETEWINVEEMFNVDDEVGASIKKLFNDARAGELIPTKEDVQGAIDGLLRLQTTYNLEPRALANGLLQGVPNAEGLNIEHLFEIGTHAYKAKDYQLSIQWLSVALEEFGGKHLLGRINKADVYDYLAANFHEIGDLKNAYEVTKELADLRPDDFRIQSNVQYLQDAILDMDPVKVNNEHDDHSEVYEDNSKVEKKREAEEYAKLCRGNSPPISKHQARHLKCWYRKRDVILFIKPQKVERLWVSPDILLFHEIMNDNESKAIRELAYPLLKRAKVFYSKEKTGYHDSSRISKNAWLDSTSHLIIKSLRKRVQAVTNLDMNFSEDLQVANYGIGGHFKPHYDHAHKKHANFSYKNLQKRIATLLFYLSDTKAGGRTVFTDAGASIAPVKNSAVFWYNLKRNGLGDIRTKHAGCPVLMGEKWVSNWWVHSDGQMLRRPCALKRNW